MGPTPSTRCTPPTGRSGPPDLRRQARQLQEHLLYQKDRVFAFAIVLGPLDDIIWSTGAGAINMGFPAIADTDIPVIHPTGVCTYEEVEKELDHAKIVQKAIELRGLKITVEKPPIPVAYGPAFEGERIRKEDTFIEMAGSARRLRVGEHARDGRDRGQQGHRRRHGRQGALRGRRPDALGI
jgi:hypothetical protein